MATGITKVRWEEDTFIISSADEFDKSFDYQITYKGKKEEKEIINNSPQNEYDSIYEASDSNKIFYGDNLDVLSHLIHDCDMKEKIKLVYIDPPYGTNSIFQSRNQKSSYKDDLIGSHYIEFMRRRLILLRELLTKDGSIYVHLDGNMAFQIKVIMDEIFGSKYFRGFITRKKCSNKNSTRKTYGNISDYILFYSKSDKFTWIRATEAWSEEKMLKEYPCIDEATGRRYKKVPIHAPGVRNGETGKQWKGMMPPPGKHWQYTPTKLTELDDKGEIYWSANGNPRRKVFFDKDKGIPVQDIWLDVQDSLNQNIKITGYPTEKNPYLLERIIKASSNEGDIVLDCFNGSGTTIDIADQLKRKFIGIDNSSEAIFNTLKRFVKGVEGMGDFVKKKTKNLNGQQTLFEPKGSYNSKLKNRKSFQLLSDKRFSSELKEMLIEFELKE